MSLGLLVTTPKGEMKNAEAEAAQVVAAGGGTYFRYLGRNKPNTAEGDRIYYVEDGAIQGFCVIRKFERKFNQVCSTTGRRWPNGWYAYMDATSWQWIEPIPYKGFQAWRYFNNDLFGARVKVIGDWKMTKHQLVYNKTT